MPLPTLPLNVRIAKRLPWPTLKTYAWCKLGTDPVYAAVAQRLLPTDQPVLDIGCGVGLLGFYLREHGFGGPYLGVDPDERKIKAGQKAERRRQRRTHGRQRRVVAANGQANTDWPRTVGAANGQAANRDAAEGRAAKGQSFGGLSTNDRPAKLISDKPGDDGSPLDLRVQNGEDPALFGQWADQLSGDHRLTPGHVVMLDVLHYFDSPTQDRLLERMAQATAPGSWCILRLTPATDSWRFTMTRGLERFARGVGWMSRPAQSFPEIDAVTAPFKQSGFDCEVASLWGNTPFNGYLFAMRKPGAAADPESRR